MIKRLEENTILQELDLEEELFYQTTLLPLWEVWKHFLQNEAIIDQMDNLELEKKVQKLLFFLEIANDYKTLGTIDG